MVVSSDFSGGDFDSLITTICDHISPESWATNGGGPAEVTPFSANDIYALVISNRLQEHHKIAALLADLRALRGTANVANPAPISVEELRDKLMLLSPPGAADETVAGEPSGVSPESSGLLLNANELADAAQRGNQFSIDLFRKTVSGSGGNELLCGYGAREMLVLAYLGSRGSTQAELQRLLQLSEHRRTAAVEILSLRSKLAGDARKGNEFHVANALWVQKQMPLKTEYVALADRFMGASVRPIDFSQSTQAADEINRWAAENTNNRINNVADRFPANVRMLLTNAVYFLGKWETPFDAEKTQSGDFHVAEGQTVGVPLMSGQVALARSGLDADTGAQLAELPYEGVTKSMVILLPAKRDGALTELESKLSAAQIKDWLACLTHTSLNVRLPKFSFQRSYGLSAPIGQLGAKQVFDMTQADFSGISDQPLYLQQIQQVTFIRVDEQGTEAAAVTSGAFGGISSVPLRELIVDRPFLFLIRDLKTGCILFIGRVVDPRS